MRISAALKAFLIKMFALKSDIKDDVLLKVAQKKLADGKLKQTDVDRLNAIGVVKKTPVPGRPWPPAPVKKTPVPSGADGGGSGAMMTPKQIQDLITSETRKALQAHTQSGGGSGGSSKDVTPALVFSKASQIRVKGAAEQYSTSTKQAIYPQRTRKDGTGSVNPFAGQPASYQGKLLSHPSDLDKAVSAAWIKWCITEGGVKRNVTQLTDHDRDLVMYAMHSMAWTGRLGAKGSDDHDSGHVHRQKLTQLQVKTLLDDTVSGGIEAAPIVFDEAIILIPVLFGELFPHVNVVNIGRGRRIKGAIMQNPTFTSGTSEGTAITPFNTSSFVSAFDTPINVASGAMEIGLDFEEDSPVDLGSTIIEKYGDKAMEWLDRVIAVGNGYNEPLGFFNTSGLTVITSDNGVGGPPTVSDYEGMMFGVAKQWRSEPGAVTAYVANDTSYRRARAIKVGPGDERRVFGMSHADYMLLDRPYKVQNDIPNSKQGFFNLKRYRLYRRLGMTVRVETQGRTLALSNTRLVVVRMRFGGQPEHAGAGCITTSAQQ